MVLPMRLFATAALVLLPALSAVAEPRVEDLIFEDCGAAREAFIRVTPERRKAIFDFLPRVITLSTHAPGASELLAQMPGQTRPGEVVSGPAWHTLDAKREVRGKRCAVELIEAAGAEALPSIPSLAEIYSKENLSDEIAVALEEATASVAEKAHRQGLTPSDAEIATAVRVLESERPLIAQNFLHEYVSLSLPQVVRHLSMLDGSDGQKVIQFLSEVDPDGSRSMRAFLDLLVSLPDEQQRRLARQIPLPQSPSLAQFMPELARLAADQGRSAAFLPLLAKSCIALGSVSVDSGIAQLLAQRSAFDQLDAEEQKCMLRSVPLLSKRVVAMLSSSSPDEQRKALEIFAGSPKSFNSEQRAAALAKIQQLALSADDSVRRAALKNLVFASDKRAEASFALAALLTKASTESGEEARATRQAALEVLAEIPQNKESAKLVPLALQAIRESPPAAGAVSFLARDSAAENELVKMLQSGEPGAANGALTVIASMKSFPKRAIQPAFDLLKDPALAREAEAALVRLPAPQAVPLLKKLLPRAAGAERTSLLALLQSFGSASKQDSLELLGALSAEGCAQLAGRGAAIQKLLLRRDIDSASLAPLRDRCALCLGEIQERDAKELIGSSLAEAIAQSSALPRTFAGGGLSDELQERLIDLALSSTLSGAQLSALAAEALKHGSRPARLKLLSSPQLREAASADVIEAIRAIAKEAGRDEQLLSAALRALASLGDQGFDWKRFVRDEVDAAGRDESHLERVREVLKLLPASLVLEEVAPALDSDERDRVVGACRVGAALGPQAVPIVSKLWSLREKITPSVRYAAVLALLEINPLTPDLQEHLKRLLVNRYYPSALTPPIEWRNTVAVVELHPDEFGTLRTVRLERLLAQR